MSLVRLGVAHKIVASSKTVIYRAGHVAPFARFTRWQSTGTHSSGLTTLRALVYGTSTAGLMIGGSLVYANYNPSFRNKADEYVPGFARLADFTAGVWVGASDTIKQKSAGKAGMKKDLGSKLDSQLADPNEDAAQNLTPSVIVSKEEKKENYAVEMSDKDKSVLKEGVLAQTVEATADKEGGSPLSTEESSEAATKYATGLAVGDSIHQSSQCIKEEKQDEKSVIIQKVAESQPEMLNEVAVAPVESTASADSGVSVVPGVSMEGAVVSMKEVTAEGAMDVQSAQIEELQGTKSSEEHFQWLKDAAQAELLLQEVYDRFRDLDKKTYDLREVLIQAENHRQDKYTQAMRIIADNETLMQTTAEDISKADEAVLTAEKNVTASQLETNEVGQELASLLDRASGLGLKSKVEEIRKELSQLHARAMMGAIDYAEKVSGSNVYQDEMEKVKDSINSELGTSLLQAESQQKAIILVLKKRVDVLLQKLEEAENDYQGRIADALLKQKQELEQMAEKKVQLHLQVREQEIWREAQKKQNKAIIEKEEELKEQLVLQAAAHTQHLSEALQAQAEQLGAKWESQTEVKLTQQETHYQNELVKIMAGLRGIEAMVDTIARAGEKTRQQQGLRTACDTLSAALEQADLITDPNRRYSFMKEIVSLQEAAYGDHFILAVLDSIPREAVNSEHGIQSEAGLQQRFKKVKRVCKQIALVPETGGLGTYALSYLHYMVTFDLWKQVNNQKYPVNMDTFELLQVADVLLEEGNIEGAIRLVNHLQGEPKRVAQDWLRDAQLHLETKQAISLVQNYMASISLSIIR